MKYLLFLLLMAGIGYSEIVGEIISVKEFRGNLFITVKYYDDASSETVLKTENICIANNENTSNALKKAIQNTINQLSDRKQIYKEKTLDITDGFITNTGKIFNREGKNAVEKGAVKKGN